MLMIIMGCVCYSSLIFGIAYTGYMISESMHWRDHDER